MTPFMFNVEAWSDSGDEVVTTFVVWAATAEDAVNEMIAMNEIDENPTGSHGPKWSCEELVDPGHPRVETGCRVGLGIRRPRRASA